MWPSFKNWRLGNITEGYQRLNCKLFIGGVKALITAVGYRDNT
jgi:hypothetical protein